MTDDEALTLRLTIGGQRCPPRGVLRRLRCARYAIRRNL